jgi:NAD(P)-dependent dehydrogenase (short-subunit alcohol dehydrogenase family)
MKRYLIIGASRGIGAAVATHLASQGHEIVSVSRSSPGLGEWIQADISTAAGIDKVATSMAERALDGLLFLGGVWEHGAFTSDYDFTRSPDDETRFVISVNLIAPIELTKRLHPNLGKSENPRAIYIGALSGLENSATPEVANTASKFGLRGAVQALRLSLATTGIGFTVINPGNLETEEVLNDIKEGRFPKQFPIPLSDLCSLVDWLLSLSRHTEVGEVNLMQKPPH